MYTGLLCCQPRGSERDRWEDDRGVPGYETDRGERADLQFCDGHRTQIPSQGVLLRRYAGARFFGKKMWICGPSGPSPSNNPGSQRATPLSMIRYTRRFGKSWVHSSLVHIDRVIAEKRIY